jgi:hypothetical protein
MSMKERAPRGVCGGAVQSEAPESERAVSLVMGEMLLILVVAIIALYDSSRHTCILSCIQWIQARSMSCAQSGSSSVTIVHMGGGTLRNAFTVNAAAPVQYLDESGFNETSSR